jgi:hypothetical protein
MFAAGAPPTSCSCTRCVTRHSSDTGDAATRGGVTSRAGAISSSAAANSLWPRGSEADVAFICSRSSQVAMFQTNSSPDPANVAESFGPSLENITIGGRSQTALK